MNCIACVTCRNVGASPLGLLCRLFLLETEINPQTLFVLTTAQNTCCPSACSLRERAGWQSAGLEWRWERAAACRAGGQEPKDGSCLHGGGGVTQVMGLLFHSL